MSYTKSMRRAKLDAAAPYMIVEHRRMYLCQSLQGGGQVKIDATGLYHFLKEMFTTDWESEYKKLKEVV